MPALYKAKGKTTDAPGTYDLLLGHQNIDDVVFVDQSPSANRRDQSGQFVGAFDAIRAIYAKAALAVERGYTQGTFSFNAGNGPLPDLLRLGFEHVEMQFLSDVYLRCPDCDGTRFRAEVREVKGQRQKHQRCAGADRQRSDPFFADIKGGAEVLRTCSRSRMLASTTCASGSRCRRFPAARRSASNWPGIWPRAPVRTAGAHRDAAPPHQTGRPDQTARQAVRVRRADHRSAL